MGRLRADPGEKHEPRVAISSPTEHLDLRRSPGVPLPISTTAVFFATEDGLRRLTQAAIEKPSFACWVLEMWRQERLEIWTLAPTSRRRHRTLRI
jgi:hypothetical protein